MLQHIDVVGLLAQAEGLTWDPAIKGILVVALGFTILCGSVYLIVATNTGARLGLLISLAALFGWLTILSMYWTVQPPGIGPSGPLPSWQPVEVVVADDDPPITDEVRLLPSPDELPDPAELVEANPELAEELFSAPTLSDIAGVQDPDNPVLPTPETLDEPGWTVLPTSDAGEPQAAADLALTEQGTFGDINEYKKLDTFAFGDGLVVVQLQQVLPAEPIPGAPPPTPVVDESKPLISVVLERDAGNIRQLPITFLVISVSLFAVFTLMLHYRDQVLDENLAAPVKKSGS